MDQNFGLSARDGSANTGDNYRGSDCRVVFLCESEAPHLRNSSGFLAFSLSPVLLD